MDSPTLTVSPSKQQQLAPPYIKRHGHKRSSAISGDFDVNNGMFIFLNNGTNNHQAAALSKSVPLDATVSPIRKHAFGSDVDSKKTPPLQQQQQQQPIPLINVEDSSFSTASSSSPSFNYDSPLKSSPHTLNSPYQAQPHQQPQLQNPHHVYPAHQQQQKQQHPQQHPQPPTKFFMTDETRFDKFSDIPNALIDLDDIITKPQQIIIKHKRTESAPAVFNGFGNNNNSNASNNIERFLTSPVRNQVVVEEEEESDMDGDNESISSHLLSKVKFHPSQNSESSSINSMLSGGVTNTNTNTNTTNNVLLSFSRTNVSSNSLQSITQQSGQSSSSTSSSESSSSSAQQQEPQPLSPDKSVSSLRGKGARYQNYYSTQQKVGSVKPLGKKLSSNDFHKPMSRSSSRSPTRSSVPSSSNASRSPVSGTNNSGFKFESVPYDMPEGLLSDYYYNEKPKLNAATPTRSSSPLKNELVMNQQQQQQQQHRHDRSKSLQQLSSSPERNGVSSTPAAASTTTAAASHNNNNNSNNNIEKKSVKTHKKSSSLFSSITKIHLRRNSTSSTASVSSSASRNRRNQNSKTTASNEDLIRRLSSSRQKMTYSESQTSIHDQTLTSVPNFGDLTLTNLGEPGPMIFNPVGDDIDIDIDIVGVLDDDNDTMTAAQVEEEQREEVRHEVKEDKKTRHHRWWFRRK